jgi:hypothetical protein
MAKRQGHEVCKLKIFSLKQLVETASYYLISLTLANAEQKDLYTMTWAASEKC